MTICDTIADAHYGKRADMAMAFAELLNQEARELEAEGVDLIQFDEPAFNVFMDDVKEWGIAALHKAIEGLKCQTAVHICYGYGIQANLDWKESLGSEWRQYEEIFPALNESRLDQVSLECANSKVPLSLIGLLSNKTVMVGAIDVASETVETPEQVAATIRAAMDFVDAERISPCTNCGMAPAAPRGRRRQTAARWAPARRSCARNWRGVEGVAGGRPAGPQPAEAGPGAAFDGGGDEALHLHAVAQQLQHAQLFLAGVAVGGDDIAGQRIGRLAHPLRQGAGDDFQRMVQPVLAGQEIDAHAGHVRQLLGVETFECRQMRTISPIMFRFRVGHVAVRCRYQDHGVNQGRVLVDHSVPFSAFRAGPRARPCKVRLFIAPARACVKLG